MPMHRVALMGRLGNQLFQVAFARWLASSGHDVSFDRSFWKRSKPGVFDMPGIGTEVQRHTSSITRALPAKRLDSGGVPSALRSLIGPNRVVWDESALGPDEIDASTPSWWFGYWQRTEYAHTLREDLQNALACRGQQPASGHRIAVHVRRGDYVGNPMGLDGGWYWRATGHALDAAGHDSRIIVFTDDRQWCLTNLRLPAPFMVAESSAAIDDLASLIHADTVVCSMSTFSWWGAFVGDHRVFAPIQWHLARDADQELGWELV